jgi:penicillin-binding protein 1B
MPKAIVREDTWRAAPFRRGYQLATSKVVLAPFIIISLLLIGFLYYYYTRYSAIIDAGLRGDIFVRSSGIYAAPLNLRSGSGVTLNGLIAHLRNVGYLERSAAELANNDRKGKYAVHGASVDIFPGSDGVIDSARAYDNIRVTFGRGGETIQNITDLDNGQQLPRAQVEPELISSVVNQEREKRKIIEFKDLPQSLVDAITSVEDRAFFDHSGINWRGVLRALMVDYQAGELKEGGSSITQQLVKSFFLNPEKSWKRKLSEAYMAVILEQRLTKQEVMAMYCNQIYLGQRGGFSINGFGEAARAYFGKDVSHLDMDESALLAGIIRSPNYYSPYSHQDRALQRRNKVLDIMVEAERLTADQAEAAKKRDLGLTSRSGLDSTDAPYFIDYLTRQLEREYDDRAGSLRSLRIYSTIDLDLQHAAYQAVYKYMANVDKMLAKRRGGTAGLQAALVAMNSKTGEIVAMVGGRDYALSQLNRATDAKRQPGSIFKPFVYAAALSAGADENNHPITPATTFMDEPRTFDLGNGQVYNPGNFGDKYDYHAVTVRDALVYSKNVIAVQVTEAIGFRPIQQLCERAGLTRVPAVTSVALGVGEATPLQMTSAYSSFSNGGRRVLPIAIRRVTSKDGKSLWESKTETREVMSPQVAYVMTSMMQDVIDRGTGTRVRQMGFHATAAGKTGSSRDGWFAGYTPNLVCIVWVGFDNNDNLGLTGGVVAAPIWTEFMARALRLRPELGGDFEDPGGIVAYEIDPLTGAIASGSPNARRELFIQGTNPGDGSPPPESPAHDPDRASPNPPTAPNPPILEDENKTPRPAPIPEQTGEPRIAGIDADLIPVPPEVRDKVRMSAPPPDSDRSLFGRIRDIFSSGPAESPKSKATPAVLSTPYRPSEGAVGRDPLSAPPGLSPASIPQVATRPRKVEEPRRADQSDEEKGKFGKNQKTADTRGAPAGRSAKPVERKVELKKQETKTSTPQKKPTPIVLKAPKSSPTPIVLKAAKPTGTPIVAAKPVATPIVLRATKPASTPIVRVVSKPTPTPLPAMAPEPLAPVVETPAPAASREKDSFMVEVCSETGLLPVPDLCPRTRRRFTAATVPTKSCSAARHRGRER